jgi:hypothetical protein
MIILRTINDSITMEVAILFITGIIIIQENISIKLKLKIDWLKKVSAPKHLTVAYIKGIKPRIMKGIIM